MNRKNNTTLPDATVYLLRCALCGDLAAEFRWWLRYQQQLRHDLRCSRGYFGEAVLRDDIAHMERQITGLLAIEWGQR